MNATISLAVVALCLGLSAPSFANDEHHREQAVGAKPVATVAPAASAKTLETNATRLQAQARRIARTPPGAHRDKLVAEHLHTLHHSMEMAEGMMQGMEMEHCPMMGGKGMGGMGGMGTGVSEKPDATVAERVGRLEKRVDMMDMMMKGGASKP